MAFAVLIAAAVAILFVGSASALTSATPTTITERISASAPLNPAVVVASGAGDGNPMMLKSTDGGATWTETPSAVTTPAPLGDGTTMIGVLQNRIQRSTDGGTTWTSVGPSFPSDPSDVQFPLADPVRPADAWLCNASASSYSFDFHTRDAGATWKKSRRQDGCRPNSIQPGGNHVLLAVDDISPTEGYVLRSTDGGNRWKRIRLPHAIPGTEAVFDTTKPNVVVIGADNLDRHGDLSPAGLWSIWRSTDAGLRWKKIWRVPKGRCDGGAPGCSKYYLDTPWANPSPVFADKRFVLGPLGAIRYGSALQTRGASYLVSSDHGLHWRTFAAPHLTGGCSGCKYIFQMPQTGDAVPTNNGVIAQGLGRPPSLSVFWRLPPGSKSWQQQQFVVTNAPTQ